MSTPKGLQRSLQILVEATAGSSLTGDPEFGGQGCPRPWDSLDEYLDRRQSLHNVPRFTMERPRALHAHKRRIKQRYSHKMIQRRMDRTMNPDRNLHCGTDLGLISRPKTTRRADGSFPYRAKDIHLRRARPRRQYHPLGAGPHRRCANRRQGHFAVVPGSCRRQRSLGVGNALPAVRSNTRWAFTGNSTCVNSDDAQGLASPEKRSRPECNVRQR